MRPVFFFFNDTATTEIYTLSLHDALPICSTMPDLISYASNIGLNTEEEVRSYMQNGALPTEKFMEDKSWVTPALQDRSEEHTSELQSQSNLVCRLLLEKKKHHQTANSLAR